MLIHQRYRQEVAANRTYFLSIHDGHQAHELGSGCDGMHLVQIGVWTLIDEINEPTSKTVQQTSTADDDCNMT